MKFYKKYCLILTIILIISVLIVSCTGKNSLESLKMATTTSTDNTGLLDYLNSTIKKTGINLQWVAVGTGRALELGKNCDVDILLVHAPGAEKKYMKNGYGVKRREIMYNDFVLIGPVNDPAGIKGKKISEVFNEISKKGAFFASRGDNSGTYKKEVGLWKNAGLNVPEKVKWYLQTGQGMLNTINIAVERDAYTLTDRGTYIKFKSVVRGTPPLVILSEGDESLRNQYSLLIVNPKKCKDVKFNLAKKFVSWMISPSAQKLIGNFKLKGEKLFIPNAE